jgi:hypothetical protein
MRARGYRGITHPMSKSHPIQIWLRRRMVDAVLDAYVDWCDECRAVWDAYRVWASAPVAEDGFAFVAYSTALDREQCAAEIYAEQIRRVGGLLKTELDHATGLTSPPPGAQLP